MTIGATENITNRSLQIKGKRSVYVRTSWTSMCRYDIRSHEWQAMQTVSLWCALLPRSDAHSTICV